MRRFLIALALASGCGESPVGGVSVEAGTLPDGEVLITMSQGYFKNGPGAPEGLDIHSRYLLVDVSGHTEELHGAGRQVLADDCSNQPPSLGSCTTSTWQPETMTRTYSFADGGRLDFVTADHTL